jgi:hypothetical protein
MATAFAKPVEQTHPTSVAATGGAAHKQPGPPPAALRRRFRAAFLRPSSGGKLSEHETNACFTQSRCGAGREFLSSRALSMLPNNIDADFPACGSPTCFCDFATLHERQMAIQLRL